MHRVISPLRDRPVESLSHWVAGAPQPADGRLLDVSESATGAVIAHVPVADAALVDRTVQAATAAAAVWGSTSISRRTQVLFRFRALVEEHADELADVIAREHGKIRSDARGEVARGLDVVDFACGIGQLLKGEMSPEVSTGYDAYSMRQPLGVVAGVTPFNFPVMVPMWMFPIALAAGNAFILKPSEQDPSPSLMLAELLSEAGLPAGAFSVLHGDRETVDAIITHPGVAAVSFVGSTAVARHVYATAAGCGKRAQALGGAKNHAVVLPDADLGLAVDGIVSAAYGSAGERCMAVSVAVAVGSIADELVAGLRERVSEIVVGAGDDPQAQMGPLISRAHEERVRGYVDGAVAEGAELIVDGRTVRVAGLEGGHFLGPCLLDGVRPGMRVYDEEVFGPVLGVVRVDDFDAALQLINDSPYGNGASVFTRDGGAARSFERGVAAGMVGINVPIPVPMAYHSFGGWKESLFGSHHVHGPEGVRFYTRMRAVAARWPDPRPRGLDLGFPVSS